jgi:hypothetical protein
MRMESRQNVGADRGRRTVRIVLALALAALLIAVAVSQARAILPNISFLPNVPHIGGRTVDNSQPAVLLAVQDLSKYDAAKGSFQVIVDLEKDPTFLPGWIAGKRWLFVAAGSVDSYIDFSHLNGNAVDVSGDRTAVKLRLPHARLDKPNIDHQQSGVFDEQRGVLTSVASIFAPSSNDERQLYLLGEQKIADAARQAHLTDAAETNARTMLTGMMRGLGFQRVTITYE